MDKPVIGLREGILLGEAWPQTPLFEESGKDYILCGACIIGGLAHATGIGVNESGVRSGISMDPLREAYPELTQIVTCPLCPEVQMLSTMIAYHLGAGRAHGLFTRRNCVEWLDSIGITELPTETTITKEEVEYAIQ